MTPDFCSFCSALNVVTSGIPGIHLVSALKSLQYELHLIHCERNHICTSQMGQLTSLSLPTPQSITALLVPRTGPLS